MANLCCRESNDFMKTCFEKFNKESNRGLYKQRKLQIKRSHYSFVPFFKLLTSTEIR